MRHSNFIYLLFIPCFLATLTACKKYLNEKSDASLVIPQKASDLQALLDNNAAMNLSSSLGEGSADNYYLTYDNWASLTSQSTKNTYTWGDELFFQDYPNDWSRLYMIVYSSNIALEYVERIERTTQNKTEWENVKGSALFFRSRSFLTLALNWANAYDEVTARTEMGIPLRTDPDFNIITVRASIEDTYQQINTDLKTAIPFLPVTATHVMRPSKPAAFALLARTYLSMRKYEEAGLYADSSLQLYNSLLDYNTLVASQNFPIAAFNTEVLFHNIVALPQQLNNTRAVIDSNLYNSYAPDDLRKVVFFKSNGNGTYGFKGSYNGSVILFVGLATDEMYLTRAECHARMGNKEAALNDLNTLMKKRWRNTITYSPITASNGNEALTKILVERRKELLMRDIRWMDIKRLNREGANISPKRILNTEIYQLVPNDLKFALPFPGYIIDLTGMPQNPR